MSVVREVEQTYTDMSDDVLDQLLQLHRRRVREAAAQLQRERANLEPFENEARRREATRG